MELWVGSVLGHDVIHDRLSQEGLAVSYRAEPLLCVNTRPPAPLIKLYPRGLDQEQERQCDFTPVITFCEACFIFLKSAFGPGVSLPTDLFAASQVGLP